MTNTDELIYSACCSPHIVAEVKTTCYNMTAVIRAFGGAGPDAQDRVFRLNYKYARTPAARQTDRQTDTHTHTHTHTIFCRTTQTRWHFLHCMHACTHFARISSHACMHARMYACRTTHTHNVVHDLITYTHADTCTRSCIHLCVCIRRYWHYCHLLVVCLIMSIWVLSLKALHRTPEGGTCALSAMMFYSSSHVHVV